MPLYSNNPIQSKDPLPPINPGEAHVAAVLLVDASDSMSYLEPGSAGITPIEELNQGLIAFGQALREDELAFGRAEVCVISFNSSVQTEVGFRPATEYEAPVLSTNGLTSLNEAIMLALDTIEERKKLYKELGTPYYRPWLFILTDGAPTDTEKESIAKERLRKAIENKKVVYLPMGIGKYADENKLREYYPEVYLDEKGESKAKVVLRASAENFKNAFVWLSQSITIVGQADPTTQQEVSLPKPPEGVTITVG